MMTQNEQLQNRESVQPCQATVKKRLQEIRALAILTKEEMRGLLGQGPGFTAEVVGSCYSLHTLSK